MAKNLDEILKTSEELNDIIGKQKEIMEKIVESERQYIAKREHFQVKVNYAVLFFFLTLVILFAGFFFLKYINVISQNFSVLILVILMFLCALFLFLFREIFRVGYGFIEIIVGLSSIISLFSDLKYDNSKISQMEIYLKLGGGLYIIVRGLDNVSKYFENKKFGFWLKKNFRIGK